MAASIPVLRVLFKDIKASSRRYYLSADGNGTSRSNGMKLIRSPSSTTAPRSDGASDIEKYPVPEMPGRIMKTHSVEIEIRCRGASDEMGHRVEHV